MHGCNNNNSLIKVSRRVGDSSGLELGPILLKSPDAISFLVKRCVSTFLAYFCGDLAVHGNSINVTAL